MNRQNRSELINTENKLEVAIGEGRGGGSMGNRWRILKKYIKFIVTLKYPMFSPFRSTSQYFDLHLSLIILAHFFLPIHISLRWSPRRSINKVIFHYPLKRKPFFSFGSLTTKNRSLFSSFSLLWFPVDPSLRFYSPVSSSRSPVE